MSAFTISHDKHEDPIQQYCRCLITYILLSLSGSTLVLELFNISSDLPPPSGETGVRHRFCFNTYQLQVKNNLLKLINIKQNKRKPIKVFKLMILGKAGTCTDQKS